MSGASAFVMAVIGLYDDVAGLKPVSKLIAQIALAALPIYFGLAVPRLSPLLSGLVALVWIVGITNALNLLDNMDGLAAGVGAIAAITLALHAIGWGNVALAGMSAALAGACLGFLIFNFSPASIFMGDSGSLFVGYTLGTLSLLQMNGRPIASLTSLLVPVFVLLVPVFDTTLVTVFRLLAGRSPAQGGRDHSSHRLVSLGIGERRAVSLLWALAAVAGAISFVPANFPATVVVLVALLAILAVFYFGSYLGTLSVYEEGDAAASAARTSGALLFDTFVAYKGRIAEVLLDAVIAGTSYLAATLMRRDFVLTAEDMTLLGHYLPALVVIRLLCFFLAGVYRSVPGTFALSDLLTILRGVGLSSLAFVALLAFGGDFPSHSRAILVMDAILVAASISGGRMATRSLAELFVPFREQKGRRVLILGAGKLGEAALGLLKYDRRVQWDVVGFLDDGEDKVGRQLHGKMVLGRLDDLEKLVGSRAVEDVVLAISALPPGRQRQLREICERAGLSFRTAGIH
jgi:UDP-GlcNAc:undecaprenyl-phosphate GlcNAc-1-phosphate transferase